MSNNGPENISPQASHEGIRAATELFDRQAVETEAWRLIEERAQLSPIAVARQERQDNARTALMEALTASGHLSRVEISGTLQEINAQVLQRLLNGWDSSLPVHEQHRRFAEICNELVIQKTLDDVSRGILPPTTEILEISDYPEALRGSRLGYRDSNQKGMVRSMSLRSKGNGQYVRVIEQVSRSNGTWVSTFGFLGACGVQTPNKPPDLAALETPFIYTRQDYREGVVSIMRLLDEHVGKGTLYGDSGQRAAKHPAYEKLRQESSRREQEILCFVDDLAQLEEQLAEWTAAGKITPAERTQLFYGEIQRILDAICTLEPTYAEDTFGQQALAIFQCVALLEAEGRHAEAAQFLEANNYLKQSVTLCGMTISTEEAKDAGLKVNSYGELVEKGKQSWKWKQGVCVVKVCASRPGKTEVGPCSVCRKCQGQFDRGKDPTKSAAANKPHDNQKAGKLAVARAV
jgi:hypothetical protein